MDPEVLRRRARMSQSGAEHEQTRIAERGTDPDYIQHLEDFDRLSHEQIHHRVQAINPGEIHTAAQVWVSIADSMFGALSTLHATVQSALSDGMSGHIADAAAVAARRFVQDATDIAEIAHSTGHRLIATAYGAEAVRKTVPPPMTHGSASAREEQRQIALAALDANYIPIYPPAGAGVPAFFTVMTPGGDASAENLGGASDSGAGPDTPDTAGLRTTPARGTWGSPGSTSGTDEPEASPDTRAASTNSPGTQSIPRTGTGADGHDPADQTPANPNSVSQRDRAPDPTAIETTPATATPGSPFSPIGHPNTPPSLHPTPTAPDPGHSFPGPANPESPTQPRSLTPRDLPSPGGTGMLPGMYAPGSRTGTDPDSSHRCPAYLIRNREDELLGNPLPHVPQTIGAEFPAASNDLAPPDDDLT
ncbi:hypothetical protein [Nocardia concava]|uniref:hypothetical protein n=1 Tax=Nocardia concava TaxID=257281 RepID=UPI0002F512C6|nr:hypothetical protein [Nocardia concava]